MAKEVKKKARPSDDYKYKIGYTYLEVNEIKTEMRAVEALELNTTKALLEMLGFKENQDKVMTLSVSPNSVGIEKGKEKNKVIFRKSEDGRILSGKEPKELQKQEEQEEKEVG